MCLGYAHGFEPMLLVPDVSGPCQKIRSAKNGFGTSEPGFTQARVHQEELYLELMVCVARLNLQESNGVNRVISSKMICSMLIRSRTLKFTGKCVLPPVESPAAIFRRKHTKTRDIPFSHWTPKNGCNPKKPNNKFRTSPGDRAVRPRSMDRLASFSSSKVSVKTAPAGSQAGRSSRSSFSGPWASRFALRREKGARARDLVALHPEEQKVNHFLWV